MLKKNNNNWWDNVFTATLREILKLVNALVGSKSTRPVFSQRHRYLFTIYIYAFNIIFYLLHCSKLMLRPTRVYIYMFKIFTYQLHYIHAKRNWLATFLYREKNKMRTHAQNANGSLYIDTVLNNRPCGHHRPNKKI